PMAAFHRENDAAALREVCEQHTGVLPAENYDDLGSAGERERAIVQLQQKALALETEVRQRRRVEDTLRERNQTLAALVEASPLPIVVVECQSTLVHLWNPAAERVFGWRKDEIVGQPMPNVPPGKAEECAAVRDAIAR